MSVPPEAPRPPEEILHAFLEAHPEPSPAEVEALCGKHPDHAADLRRLLAAHRQAEAGPGLHRRSRLGGPFASAFRVKEGMVIGDYRVLRLLGRGGMGEVWEAEQVSLSRRVALKLLLPERVDQKGLDFFAREARAGGRLSHPGIVAIHGTGEDEGLHWIAMELVEDACDLRHSIDGMRDEDELPADYYRDVAEFMAQVADALEAAHAGGVIHRDLKPGNILVTSDDHPKVVDFGLAKLVDEHSISLAGDLVGTYFYMSPEQVAAKRMGIDHRTDIFSLGVVLYEMLTLVRPFEGDTTEQVAHKIMVVDPPTAKEVRSKVPLDLSVICGKAMEKDRDRRYGSMAELAEDLRRHLADEPILAKPSGALVRFGKWARRNPTKSVAGGVAAIALVAISGMYLQLLEEQGATAQALETVSQERDLKADALEQVQAEKTATQVALDQVEEEKAATVAALAIAETERDRAKEAEEEAAKQRDEAAQISDFQAEQLSAVDPQAMGLAIRTMVLERARAAGERAGRGEEVLDEEQAELVRLLAGTDFTGIALGVLEEQIFEGALEALEDFEEQPLVQAQLLQTVASTLHELGLLKRALEPQEQALEVRRRTLGNEHTDTLSSINSLGSLLKAQGKYAEAEPLYRDCLEVLRRTRGDEHPNTLDLIGNLGWLLKAQGKYAEAEPLSREALEGSRRTLGDEHTDTLNKINNLGSLLQAQGKYDEAEPLFREALEVIRRKLGDEHPNTLTLINNLGSLLYAQGKYAEAERFFREALDVSRRTLSDKHPDTLMSINNLGVIFWKQGHLAEAEPLYREALEGSRRTLGDEHPDTLSSINNLGTLFQDQGKYDDAEPLFREVLEIRRRTLGDEHPDTLSSSNNLGILRKAQGEYDEAESLLRDALEGRRRTLGDEHPRTLTSISNLGLLLYAQGKYDEAEPLFREALKGSRRRLGDEHPDTLNAKRHLEAVLSERDGSQTPPTEDSDR